MNTLANKILIPLKVIISVLLLLCLLDLPYGYYQLIRFISFGVFGYFAYEAYQRKSQFELIIFGMLSLLFQPFIKVSLGRDLWNILDVIIPVYIGYTVFVKKKNEEQ